MFPVPSGEESSTTRASTPGSLRDAGDDLADRPRFVIGGQDHQGSRAGAQRLGSGATGTPASRDGGHAHDEDERDDGEPVTPSHGGVRSVEARIVRRMTAGSKSAGLLVGTDPRVDEGAHAGHGGMDHPPAVLDRAHPGHLQMLRGGGRLVVGRVVREDDEELRPLPNELTIERGEAVLEADGGAESREPGRRERVQPLPRHELVGDLLERGDPSDHRLPRDVFPVGNEMGLPVDVHHLSPAVEDDGLVEERLAVAARRADVARGGSGEDRHSHVGDRRTHLVEDLRATPGRARSLPTRPGREACPPTSGGGRGCVS